MLCPLRDFEEVFFYRELGRMQLALLGGFKSGLE
jgi:hypothetical protein